MNGTDYKKTADEGVKIYVPKSFSGSLQGKPQVIGESDDVKIYSRREGNPPKNR